MACGAHRFVLFLDFASSRQINIFCNFQSHLAALKDTISKRHQRKYSSAAYSDAEAPVQADDDAYELEVLAAESNQEQHTYDGIDWGGERLVAEVRFAPRFQV